MCLDLEASQTVISTPALNREVADLFVTSLLYRGVITLSERNVSKKK